MTSRGSRRTGISRARVARTARVALLALALSGAGALAADPLYQWTDAQGNVRYTPDPDRVPTGQRDSLVTLEPGAPPLPAPARSVVIPAEPRVAAPTPPAQPSAPAVEPPAPVAAPQTVAPPVAIPSQTVAPPVAIPSQSAAPASALTAPTTTADAALLEKQLSAAIAADQETLKQLLAAPAVPGASELVDSPELRAIARRLPELQAQLRALREQLPPPAGP